MRAVVVDLPCTSPYYCAALVDAMREAGGDAELASPLFYLEPDYLALCRRPAWIVDLVIHATRPRPLRVAARAAEVALNHRNLARAIKRGYYSVVHVQWMPFEVGRLALMSRLRSHCDRAGALLVFTAHNAEPHDNTFENLRALAKNIDYAHVVIAHTEHVARQLRDKLGVRAPIKVIPHGPLFVDQRLPQRAEAMVRTGLSSGPIVLFLGLVRPYKGLDLLAESWPLVQMEFPDATLVVVGRALDEAAGQQQRALAGKPGVVSVEEYVSVRSMLDYYASSDLVVFPYRSISQSGALMSAAGLGRPIVVTPIPGFLEQVKTLRSAIVAEETTGPAIAKAINQGLGRRRELALEAERDRAAIINSPIGWAAVAERTLATYREYGRRARSSGEPAPRR